MHKAVATALITEDVDVAFTDFLSVWDEEQADEKNNSQRAYHSLNHYIHTHKGNKSLFKLLPPPPSNVKTDEKTSDYEITFGIDVGLPIPIAGRIDGHCLHRDSKELWGYEFKTTSRLTPYFFDAFELHPQLLTYALVLETMTGDTYKGIMVEGMLKHKDKVDNQVRPIFIQKHHLVAIRDWLRWNGEILLACEEKEQFPQNFAGCSAYPHYAIPSWRCEFSDLCRIPNWEDGTAMYDERPDHKFVELTTSE